jgi:Tol biopolymer transport system component
MIKGVYSTCVLAAIAAFNAPASMPAATTWTHNARATFQRLSDGPRSVGPPSISRNGRVIVFQADHYSGIDVLSDVYVADRSTGRVTVVSVAPDGSAANGNSSGALLTPDGRFVTFFSDASNLIADDDNGRMDMFIRDLHTESTSRIDLDVPPDKGLSSYVVSDKARVVAYTTVNVADPSGRHTDLFIYDRKALTTTHVPLPRIEEEGFQWFAVTSITPDGRFVVFHSGRQLTANDQPQFLPEPFPDKDVFVLDRHRGTIERISVATSGAEGVGSSWDGHISDDGRFVVFLSEAANLVGGDTVPGYGNWDIFVRDRVAKTTRRVSLDRSALEPNSQAASPAISADGRTIVYQSEPVGRVGPSDLFIYDVRRRTTERIAIASASGEDDFFYPAVSVHGRFVAFATYANLDGLDTNDAKDIYVLDRRTPE